MKITHILLQVLSLASRSALVTHSYFFIQNNAFVIIYEHILDLKILPNIFRINLPGELAEISCYSERVE